VPPYDGITFVPQEARIRFTTDVPDIIKIGQWLPVDPLAEAPIILQRSGKTFVELTLDQLYLLLLDPAPTVQRLKLKTPNYVFTTPQGGFRIEKDGRLRPIVPGGELDAYAGRNVDELIREVQQGAIFKKKTP
jgi:hypothetical protein